jgi:hypothetical protein
LAEINPDNFSNIWLAGDFNLGDIVWETHSVRPGSPKPTLCRDLIDISNDNGLEQVVTKPTRGENTLDLFFVKNPSLVTKSDTIPGISDHDGIPILLVDSKPSKSKQKPRKVYMYHKANTADLKGKASEISKDFESKDLSTTNVNELWNELKNRLLVAVNDHIPTKSVSKRNYTPWINHTIKRLHKRKQRAYNKARKSNKQEDWEKFRKLRK